MQDTTILNPVRVLILEDRPSDADLAEFELETADITFVSQRVMTESEYIKALDEFCPDIILSDYDLPQYNGALALAAARSKCPDIPFILVTGAIGEDRAIETLTQGAKDYVMKNRLHRLAASVQRALREAEEHRAHKQAEETLMRSYNRLEELVKERTNELQVLAMKLQTEIRDKEKIREALQYYQRKLEAQNADYHQAQEDLEESRRRYAELYEVSPVGHFTFDRECLIKEVNLTGASMLGAEKAFLINTPFCIYVAPAYKDGFIQHIGKAATMSEKQACTLELLKKNNSSFDAFLNTYAVSDSDGNLKHLHSVMVDITALKTH
ncbi:MAG: response regulator [Syntrophales bacterium]|nr:response regulator [Syntrophales bacterium]